MKAGKECTHMHQEEISRDHDDDGLYIRYKCLACGDEITEYYELVNRYNNTKAVEEPLAGREREREENFERYMLVGNYCDDNRPNIEVIYIDTNLTKVTEVMRLIEKINQSSEEETRKKLAIKAKKLGIAIIDDYGQIAEIQDLQIIKPVKVTVQDYHTTKEVNN
jgi:hypothetical protein